jgi:hypothetical protein
MGTVYRPTLSGCLDVVVGGVGAWHKKGTSGGGGKGESGVFVLLVILIKTTASYLLPRTIPISRSRNKVHKI